MKYQPVKSLSHAVYLLRMHIVLVTKYRRKVLTPKILSYAEKTFSGILGSWRCSLIEFGGEEDHVPYIPALKRWGQRSVQQRRPCVLRVMPRGARFITAWFSPGFTGSFPRPPRSCGLLMPCRYHRYAFEHSF